MILCMTNEQAAKCIEFKYFEVDLSFKRVYGDINEFEFNAYEEKSRTIITFCRIFTNIATKEAYQKMFETFFEIVKKLSNKPAHFRHIHSDSWVCVLADLNQVQALGLGKAMKKMDPTRKAKEHLQYVFKSCHIYYKKNVDHYPYCADTKHDMLEILKANSSEEINQIFGQIKMRNEDGIQNWLEYYQKPWVLGSLTYHYSLMSYEDWQTTPFDTNIAESAHAMINRTGKSLKLKIAILRGWKHDECIYKRIKIHQQIGIPMSSKDKSDFGKKMQANKRSVRKLSKRTTSKGKQCASKKAKIDYDDDDTEMEIEERKIALEERKMQFKQNEIDLKLKELQIKKLEMELNNN
ncbi:hypothetical protein RhiirA5_414881 [Rhizophagus irregularis]|uniref:MULE transposase domain-containing protein n=2 Tax=Rhizophagus irregularis TaxID=588596 RepID=A0A2N0PT53_9GLOM|nr:hypothetical protein RhiirA5_414881 [Rhizophagus irregularis]